MEYKSLDIKMCDPFKNLNYDTLEQRNKIYVADPACLVQRFYDDT